MLNDDEYEDEYEDGYDDEYEDGEDDDYDSPSKAPLLIVGFLGLAALGCIAIAIVLLNDDSATAPPAGEDTAASETAAEDILADIEMDNLLIDLGEDDATASEAGGDEKPKEENLLAPPDTRTQEKVEEQVQLGAPVQEKEDQGRADQERADQERADQERADQERADQEKADQERADQERADQERADQEKADQEKADQERADQERADQEKADQERADQEKADQEKADQEKAEQERADKEKADKEKAEQEKADQEKAEQDAAATEEEAPPKEEEAPPKEEEAPPKEEAPASNMTYDREFLASLGRKAASGQLGDDVVSHLKAAPVNDANYLRAMALVAAHGEAKKDYKAHCEVAEAVLSQGRYKYKPEWNLEGAKCSLRNGALDAAISRADRTISYQQEMSGANKGPRILLAYRIVAKARTSKYEADAKKNANFGDIQLLNRAIGAWQGVKNYAGGIGDSNAAGQADKEIADLEAKRPPED